MLNPTDKRRLDFLRLLPLHKRRRCAIMKLYQNRKARITVEEKIREVSGEALSQENISAAPFAENSEKHSEDAVAAENIEKMPMVWHRFQKNFLLWMIATAYFARAFLIFSGKIYLEEAIRDAVYGGMPLLRVSDYAFAAHCTAGGVFAILSAVRLRHSARMLIRNNIALCAGEAAYLLLRWAITELPPVNPQGIALMSAHGLLLWLNIRYYRNRKAYLSRKDKA